MFLQITFLQFTDRQALGVSASLQHSISHEEDAYLNKSEIFEACKQQCWFYVFRKEWTAALFFLLSFFTQWIKVPFIGNKYQTPLTNIKDHQTKCLCFPNMFYHGLQFSIEADCLVIAINQNYELCFGLGVLNAPFDCFLRRILKCQQEFELCSVRKCRRLFQAVYSCRRCQL